MFVYGGIVVTFGLGVIALIASGVYAMVMQVLATIK